MPYQLGQGVQQNHRFEYYRLGSWPTSSKTIIILQEHNMVKPFSFRFSSSEGGHIWHYVPGKESKVDFCGRKQCSICGERANVPAHRILLGAVTKWDWIKAGKELWPEGERE